MGKGGLFVVTYSVVLIVLFITFSYLMMTVNPPPLKDQENPSGNTTGPDEVLYADEVLLPSDDIEYGLEKAPIGYKSVNINLTSYRSELVDNNKYNFEEKVGSNVTRVIPPVWPDKISTLTTRVVTLTTFPKTKIPAKGFRRSVNEEIKKTKRQNVPRSLFLKIINDDGQPRIEIKLASDDIVKRKTRKYRSSGTKLKAGTESSIKNITAKHNAANYHDNKWSVIKIEENKTLVFNINDSSINLMNESEISVFHLEEEPTELFDRNLVVVNNSILKVSENCTNLAGNDILNAEVFKLHLLDKNINETKNNSTSSRSLIHFKDEPKTVVSSVNHGTENKNVSELSQTQTQTTKERETSEQINNEAISEPHDYKSTGNLIGLMIPEATATLPFNYHFIDGNDRNVFSNVIKSKRRSKRD